MIPERRRSVRNIDVAREGEKIDLALAKSKRLIAEIDVLLEHSHELMDRQALLHRSWRW
jgi:hypothetical protein